MPYNWKLGAIQEADAENGKYGTVAKKRPQRGGPLKGYNDRAATIEGCSQPLYIIHYYYNFLLTSRRETIFRGPVVSLQLLVIRRGKRYGEPQSSSALSGPGNQR